MAIRYDSFTIRSDSNGVYDVIIARAGVLTYNRGGRIQRELIPPDELFRSEAMDTATGMPSTDEHPPQFIGPHNYSQFQKGTVLTVRQDGMRLRGTERVYDSSLNAAIASRQKREVSTGRDVVLDYTPGIWIAEDGSKHPYDAIQRNLRFNHMAHTVAGKAGPSVGVVDSADDDIAVMVTDLNAGDAGASDDAHDATGAKMKSWQTEDGKTIQVSDDEFEDLKAGKSAREARKRAEMEATIAAQATDSHAQTIDSKKIAEMEATIAAQAATIEVLKKSSSTEAIDSVVQERMRVVDTARTLVPGISIDGVGVDDLRRSVVVKVLGISEESAKAMDSVHLGAHFDAAITVAKISALKGQSRSAPTQTLDASKIEERRDVDLRTYKGD